MKANKMTNEELAKELIETVGLDGPFCQCDRCMAVLEAAARLRKHEENLTKCDKCIFPWKRQNDDLRAKLKVAEDALQKIFNKVFVDCEVAEIAKNALAAIRGEGGNDDK